jgi:hypothetical protein
MVTFNAVLKPHMSEGELLSMMAQSSEFESMLVREVRGSPPHARAAPHVQALVHACGPVWTFKGVET